MVRGFELFRVWVGSGSPGMRIGALFRSGKFLHEVSTSRSACDWDSGTDWGGGGGGAM